MAKEFKITSLRLADLEKELNYLKTTREREVVHTPPLFFAFYAQKRGGV